MTEIIPFPLRRAWDNFNEDRAGAAGAETFQRPPELKRPLLVQIRPERPAPPKANPVGDADPGGEKPANLQQSSVAVATGTTLSSKALSRPLGDGKACMTSDYTGTAEAAILSVQGIWLVRAGKHYRSFRCCGPDAAGKLVKNWNVVEEAVGVDARGGQLWKPIHRFVSDLTDPASRLKEIDAQLRVLGILRHAAGASIVTPLFR